MIPTLLAVALLTFFLLRVMPGDIVEVKLRADGGNVTQQIVRARARIGSASTSRCPCSSPTGCAGW